MKRRSYAKKRDANEPAIVDALEAAGAFVKRTDDPADLLVLFSGKWFVLEVKTPHGKLTPDQEAFHRLHPGAVPIVTTQNEALAAVGADAMVPVRLAVRERRQ